MLVSLCVYTGEENFVSTLGLSLLSFLLTSPHGKKNGKLSSLEPNNNMGIICPHWWLLFCPLSQAVSRTGEVRPCSRSLVDAVSGPVSQPSPGGREGKSFKSGSVNLDVLSQEEGRGNPSLTLVLSYVLQYRSPEATVGVVCYQAASNTRVSVPLPISSLWSCSVG